MTGQLGMIDDELENIKEEDVAYINNKCNDIIAKIPELDEAIKTCLTKSLEKDDLNAIKSCMNTQSGKYYNALLKVIRND